MNITELIVHLSKLKAKNGDHEVLTESVYSKLGIDAVEYDNIEGCYIIYPAELEPEEDEEE